MAFWIVGLAVLYLLFLIYSAYISKKSITVTKDYILPKVGTILGFLTFSATLFSTFTLMGIPNFFRVHGVGTWIFLGVTDTALAFVMLWFGLELRKRYSRENFTNVSTIMKQKFKTGLGLFTFRIGIFIFLLPYISVQIKGISEFVYTTGILDMPTWFWATLFLIIIFIYSYVGGMKAIIYSDALQGLLLLIITFIIALFCIHKVGGVGTMFETLNETNAALLSTPGPKGLFTAQFLAASFIAIILMPISQPQLLTRIIIIDSDRSFKKMALAVALFSFLIILPTVFIGLYGAIYYPATDSSTFLLHTLIIDQSPLIGSIAIIGLIAAAMSTADSQLFALQIEAAHRTNVKQNKLYIILFGVAALALSLYSGKELVMLARISFAGTALLVPMLLLAFFSEDKKHNYFIPLITFLALIIYLLSAIFNLIPTVLGGIRIELALLIILSMLSLVVYKIRK